MAKDKETPEEVDELSGWRKLHQDYLAKKEREEKEKKEREEKERREILKTVPKREKTEDDENQTEEEEEEQTEENEIPKIPFVGKEPIEKKERVRIPRRYLLRAIPVLTVFSLLALLSIYFITPLSTQKDIRISGNQEVSSDAILKDSAIKDQDYSLTTLLSSRGHERNIRESSPWIESVGMSYHFPNRFDITIKEYDVVAYEVRDGSYYPILTNGTVVPTASSEASAKNKLLIQFQDADKIASFVKQYEQLPTSLKKAIQIVELTPSKATPDLLTLTMTGDHKVLIPLAELDQKLSYYNSILSQLTEPSVVDMESGIFSYSQAAVAQQAAEEAKAKEEGQTEESSETGLENSERTPTEESQEIGT